MTWPARRSISRRASRCRRAGTPSVTVAADRGWQNSGLRLEAGVSYRLTAAGRYQVAKTTKVWWCEPGGVSIRYYRGRPLGILLAAVRPDHPAAGQHLRAVAPERGRPGHNALARRNRHALPEDQRFGRRIGRQRGRVEGGSATGVAAGEALDLRQRRLVAYR